MVTSLAKRLPMGEKVFCVFCGREMCLSTRKLKPAFYNITTGKPQFTIIFQQFNLNEVAGKMECPSRFCHLRHLLYDDYSEWYQMKDGGIVGGGPVLLPDYDT